MDVVTPLSSLSRQLETSEGDEFHSILKLLRSPAYVNQSLLKSDIGLFTGKLLKLLRSSDYYMLWKGCQVTAVICSYNAVVLCSQSNQLLTVLYTRFEQLSTHYKDTAGSEIKLTCLRTVVNTISLLMDLIRGKPALTREVLTPKLNSIIPSLIALCEGEPKLCLPILEKLVYMNTTTFKPFINKYRAVLIKLISRGFEFYDTQTRRLICDGYAYVHLVKQNSVKIDDNQAHHKASADENWKMGLQKILSEFKPLIQLCGDLLDFTVDKDLIQLIESLPVTENNQLENSELFPPLSVDMNKPFTLLNITYRISTFRQLLLAFITKPTPFPISVPLRSIINLCEVLLGMNTNYIPLKKGLRREPELTSIIYTVLRSLQFEGIVILKTMAEKYDKILVFYQSSILSSLELFIPLKRKGTSIDYEACDSMKEQLLYLISCVNDISGNIGHKISELDLFTKLTDITLHFVKKKSNLGNLFDQVPQNKIKGKQTLKQKKETNRVTGAMSDIYSHPNQFVFNPEGELYDEANKFLTFILKNLKLPSTQQIKIIQYATTTALGLKEESGYIPPSFVELLTCLTLYPGNERVSILPIAISLLKESDSEVFEVLCNPRLPVGTIKTSVNVEDSGDKRVELKMQNETDAFTDDYEPTVVTPAEVPEIELAEAHEEKAEVRSYRIEPQESQLFRKRPSDETTEEKTSDHDLDSKRQKSHQEAHSPQEENPYPRPTLAEPELVSKTHDSDSESGSEFEIPEINLSDNEE